MSTHKSEFGVSEEVDPSGESSHAPEHSSHAATVAPRTPEFLFAPATRLVPIHTNMSPATRIWSCLQALKSSVSSGPYLVGLPPLVCDPREPRGIKWPEEEGVIAVADDGSKSAWRPLLFYNWIPGTILRSRSTTTIQGEVAQSDTLATVFGGFALSAGVASELDSPKVGRPRPALLFRTNGGDLTEAQFEDIVETLTKLGQSVLDMHSTSEELASQEDLQGWAVHWADLLSIAVEAHTSRDDDGTANYDPVVPSFEEGTGLLPSIVERHGLPHLYGLIFEPTEDGEFVVTRQSCGGERPMCESETSSG